MAESLKEKVVNGAIWNGVEKFITALLLFVSNMVLARLLAPDDFGCIGMLMVFISIADAIVDGGFGAALVQKKEVTSTDYSTIFFWNIIVSVSLYVILFLSAPVIASFYKMEILTNILRVQGVVLLFNGLCIIQRSMLQKNMLFKKLAKINIISTMAGTILGIILAYIGYGVWSLVIKLIFTSLMASIVLWTGTRWLPIYTFSKKSFRSLFKFGGFMFLASITNSIYQNVISLVIGKSMSPATLGYFTQARKLEDVPRRTISSIVTNVTFPAFSRLLNEKNKAVSALRESLTIIGFINISFSILLMITAKPLIVTLLTVKWIACVPYFRIICLYGMALGFIDLYQSVLKGLGKSNVLFYTGIIRKSIGILLILVGTFWGMKGLLSGYIIGQMIGLSIVAYAIKRILDYSLLQQIADIFKSAIAAVCAGALTVMAGVCFKDLSNLLQLITMSIIYISIMVFLTVVFRIKSGILLKDIIKKKAVCLQERA